jgi:hypothetical protein
MWRWREVATPDEYGNGSEGPLLYEQFHHASDADLFVVLEAVEPPGELVGALNLPSHARLCHIQNNVPRVIFSRLKRRS